MRGSRLACALLLCTIYLLAKRRQGDLARPPMGGGGGGADIDADLQQVIDDFAPPPKPQHCRLGLPGCVPREIENIFFLHVPKAAGSTTCAFLRANSVPGAQPFGFVHRECLVAATGMRSWHCYGMRSWHRVAGEKEGLCSAQRAAVESSAAGDWYSVLGCNAIIGHYDLSLYHRMHPSVRERTLVIVNVREPVSLLVSLYNFLPKMKGPMAGAEQAEVSNMTLRAFADSEWGLGIDILDGTTKMVAGDYCCHNTAPKHESSGARLRAALQALHTEVGVVLVKERMTESLEYLAYVLGWAVPNTDFLVNANRYAAPKEPATQRQLAQVARTDGHLYKAALAQLEMQLEVMGEDARPALPQRVEL